MRARLHVALVCALIAPLISVISGCSVAQQAANWNAAPGASAPASGGAASGGSAAPAASPSPTLPPVYNVAPLLDPAKKYIGLEIPNAPDSIAPAEQFAGWVGKKPNLIGDYVGWTTSFDVQAAKNAYDYGGIYFMVWEPFGTTLQQIASGASDAYITRFAQSVRSLNVPIALSFGHEFNGNWYPWGTKDATAAQFVAAWRHIHDLFAKAGATNVIWVWDPNDIYPAPNVSLRPYYPGDAYVDWVGVTGYWTVTGPHTYASLYLPTLTEVREFTEKPFIIAETSVEPGSNEVTSLDALFHAVESHSDILGFVWYDYDRQGDWRLEDRSDVESAFRNDVSGPDFGFSVSGIG